MVDEKEKPDCYYGSLSEQLMWEHDYTVSGGMDGRWKEGTKWGEYSYNVCRGVALIAVTRTTTVTTVATKAKAAKETEI